MLGRRSHRGLPSLSEPAVYCVVVDVTEPPGASYRVGKEANQKKESSSQKERTKESGPKTCGTPNFNKAATTKIRFRRAACGGPVTGGGCRRDCDVYCRRHVSLTVRVGRHAVVARADVAPLPVHWVEAEACPLMPRESADAIGQRVRALQASLVHFLLLFGVVSEVFEREGERPQRRLRKHEVDEYSDSQHNVERAVLGRAPVGSVSSSREREKHA
mmetsp:Transcript_14762/g.45787  ORF Transcript_14762/g.45787 Transcript_14762/m.45787 type:complete len:217 (-) Transcript_14762:1093-1743(-)